MEQLSSWHLSRRSPRPHQEMPAKPEPGLKEISLGPPPDASGGRQITLKLNPTSPPLLLKGRYPQGRPFFISKDFYPQIPAHSTSLRAGFARAQVSRILTTDYTDYRDFVDLFLLIGLNLW